jgi:hypothetical protein
MSEIACLQQLITTTDRTACCCEAHFSSILDPSMGKRHQRDLWLQDISDRQRSVVFPDTVQNEARFWRNIGDQPWTTTTKIGLGLMVVLFGGFGAAIIAATIQGGVFWAYILIMLGVCGPIFAAIAWATRRALREAQKTRKTHHVTDSQ